METFILEESGAQKVPFGFYQMVRVHALHSPTILSGASQAHLRVTPGMQRELPEGPANSCGVLCLGLTTSPLT